MPTQSFGSRLWAWAGALCDSPDHMVYLICQFLSTGLDDMVLHLSSLRHLSRQSHCQGDFTLHRVDVKPAGLLRGRLSDTPSILSSQQPSCHFPHIYPPDPVAPHTFSIGTITAPEKKHKSEKPEEQTIPYEVTLIFPCHVPVLPWNVGFQWLP